MKRLLIALVLGLTAMAGAQLRSLPRMRVEIDGQRADLGTLMADADATLVGVDQIVAALTHDRAKVAHDAKWCTISVADKPVIRIPLVESVGQYAEVRPLGAAADSPPRHEFVYDYPAFVPSGDATVMMIDVETLCGLFGVTVNLGTKLISLHTPEYWAGKLGLAPAKVENRTLLNLGQIPDFGISPPASNFYIWVRPQEAGFVQLYKLTEGTPDQLFGVDVDGGPVDHPRSELHQEPKPRPASPTTPARVETEFSERGEADYASYVAVVSRKDTHGKDLIAAINDGDLEGGDWSAVGLRQELKAGGFLFEVKPLERAISPAQAANLFKMDKTLFLKLNGLAPGDTLSKGFKVAVIKGLENLTPPKLTNDKYKVMGFYQVKPSDTLEALLARWHVSEEAFYNENPSVPDGADLDPGEIIVCIQGKGDDAPKEDLSEIKQLNGEARCPAGGTLYKSPNAKSQKVGSVPSRALVSLNGMVSSGLWYQASYGDKTGFISRKEVNKVQIFMRAPAPGAPVTTLPQAPMIVLRAITFGLQFVGKTKYLMGGNDIRKQIDCSHFVSTVYRRAGYSPPEPPVHSQEKFGELVHANTAVIEVGGRMLRAVDLGLPAFRIGPAGLPYLKTGDRLIFQESLGGNVARSGNHHTAIYIGRYGTHTDAIIHSSGHKGVNIFFLSGYRTIYRYARRDHFEGAAR